MIDIESQMLDALALLYRGLEEPLEGLDEEIRAMCFEEVNQLGDLTQAQRIMPEPEMRDRTVLRHCLNRRYLPMPIDILTERFLDLYENAPIPQHNQLIVDTLPTHCEVPLTRVRNIQWDRFTYEASVGGKFLTWAHLLTNADMANPTVADRLYAQQMQPCYEHDTASLQYKLYARWNLSDALPSYSQEMGLTEGVFLAMHPNNPATDFLVHFQFMLTTWIELNVKEKGINLREAALSYCMDLPEDVFQELMPPLSQIVVIDYPNQTLYHFGTDPSTTCRMMHDSHPEFA